MHCRVCESAKKSPAVIASHFPKNRDGVTVCPTLLSQQCRGCGKKGHTIGYCTLKQEPSYQETRPRPTEKVKAKAKAKETRPNKAKQTMYDALYVSDEEREEQGREQEEQKTIVKKVKVKTQKDTKEVKPFCWATAESDSSGSESESDSD